MDSALQRLIADLKATAFFLDEPTARVKAPKKLHKLLRHLKREELKLLYELLTERRALVGKYAVRPEKDGYSVRCVDEGSREHFVNRELTKCSCEDHKFRERDCKHIRLLKGAGL